MKKLELYTRPTCSDCQAAKAFLQQHHIPYIDYDLTKQPDKEAALLRFSGSRIVPAFVFKSNAFLGAFRKPEVLIGFENNFAKIKKLLDME